MQRRPIFEIFSFIAIAMSLHVAAAAVLQHGGAPAGKPDLPTGAGSGLSTGSAGLQEIVDGWDTPPDIQTTTDPLPPEAPELAVAEVAPNPAILSPQPSLVPPIQPVAEASPVLPNLPEPTEPQPVAAQPELALTSSERPVQRPAKPATQQTSQKPKAQATKKRTKQQAAPSQTAQAASGGKAGTSAGGGGKAGSGGKGGEAPGPSQDSLRNQWKQQVNACLSRKMRPPRNLRKSGLVQLNIAVARNGTIQGIGLAASSGDAALDQMAFRAAKRVRRCPAAPSNLQGASYTFKLPIRLNGR